MLELLKWLPPVVIAFLVLWGTWRLWGEMSGQQKLEDHHGWQNHGWRTCIICGEKDGVEVRERTNPAERGRLALKPCKFCGATEADQTREIFRKWWWVIILVVTVFYIWVRYFTETTKPAEPAWPSGKPKAATEAEIAAKAKSFADFKAAAEAKAKAADKKPLTKEESAKVIEAAIWKAAKKPTGELTKADLEKVIVLHLDRNQLTSVKGLEKLTELENLILYNNQLTSVKGLEKLPQLAFLNLARNKLTDVKGIEKLTQLKELRLNSNQLTDAKGLEKLTQLTWLDLRYNPALTKAQIAELQKALPKCKIFSNPKK